MSKKIKLTSIELFIDSLVWAALSQRVRKFWEWGDLLLMDVKSNKIMFKVGQNYDSKLNS